MEDVQPVSVVNKLLGWHMFYEYAVDQSSCGSIYIYICVCVLYPSLNAVCVSSMIVNVLNCVFYFSYELTWFHPPTHRVTGVFTLCMYVLRRVTSHVFGYRNYFPCYTRITKLH